ncbi:MAG: hypothetical protein ABIK97_07310 [candidate division WOR-3 bacterium]
MAIVKAFSRRWKVLTSFPRKVAKNRFLERRKFELSPKSSEEPMLNEV